MMDCRFKYPIDCFSNETESNHGRESAAVFCLIGMSSLVPQIPRESAVAVHEVELRGSGFPSRSLRDQERVRRDARCS